jgi:hypothetical protein
MVLRRPSELAAFTRHWVDWLVIATVLQDATKQIANYGILCTKGLPFFQVKSSKA